MPEIEREGILEQRLEEMQRFQDARNLDQMVKAQKGGETESSKVPKRAQLSTYTGALTYRRTTQDPRLPAVGTRRNLRSLTSTRQNVWRRVTRRRSDYRGFGEFYFTDTCSRARPILRNVKDRHPRWRWKLNPKRRKMARLASLRSKKNAKDNSTASPQRLMKPSLVKTSTNVKSPGQCWSSTMLHLGLPISVKVHIFTPHSCSLLTIPNVCRGLGEILYRNRQRSIGLSYL